LEQLAVAATKIENTGIRFNEFADEGVIPAAQHFADKRTLTG
jgi:hypothetical protein